MNKVYNSISSAKVYRFKNWSRKNYAAFRSLNIVVNIGKLIVQISDRIGKKTEKLNQEEPPNFVSGKNYNIQDEDHTSSIDPLNGLLLSLLSLLLVPVVFEEGYEPKVNFSIYPTPLIAILPSYISSIVFYNLLQGKLFSVYNLNFFDHDKASIRADVDIGAK